MVKFTGTQVWTTRRSNGAEKRGGGAVGSVLGAIGRLTFARLGGEGW